MIHPDQIKPDMSVVCSQDHTFASVEQMESSNYIKLKQDQDGRHHYIPLTWVNSIEGDRIKIDRTDEEAIRDWSSVSPTF
ncbi:DUF2171 domain-containing protein [Methylomonas sp. AM2-LC]|uniref:DUF2171 domain-containing protein n=1 Tax=Methylomonas sp. AM2-LC TaxID=3153301 RepID=UPI0032634A63